MDVKTLGKGAGGGLDCRLQVAHHSDLAPVISREANLDLLPLLSLHTARDDPGRHGPSTSR